MAHGNLVQSVERALDILDAVAHAGDGIRAQDLADRIGLKPTTLHNLARTLLSRHYLEKDHRGWYRLGPAIADVARHYHDHSILQRAMGPMQQLSARFPAATVVFGERVGADIRLQARISPERPQVMQRPLDQTFSPYANGVGLIYLAFADAETRQAIEAHTPFAEFGAHLWQSRERLDAYLAETRRLGYANVPFDTTRSLRIAVPIHDAQERLLAALGLSLPATAASLPEVRQALTTAITQLRP